MKKEYHKWIMDDIKTRFGYCNYPEMSEATFQAISECLDRHSDTEYETIADSLTTDLEKTLVKCGIKSNDAIRMSWKWSD